jgi:hypothetical protein
MISSSADIVAWENGEHCRTQQAAPVSTISKSILVRSNSNRFKIDFDMTHAAIHELSCALSRLPKHLENMCLAMSLMLQYQLD